MTTWQELRKREEAKPYWDVLQRQLAEERAVGHEIHPPEDEIFAALELTPFGEVKVVILGQDPYHRAGQAHGLAFSVRPGVKIPPSLRNIFKKTAADVDGFVPPEHGDLTPWAKQGVLLLNTALTVRGGKPGSHAKLWEDFTDEVIRALGHREQETVFILWGQHAQKKGRDIHAHHCVITSSHPVARLSARDHFRDSAPFSEANAFLRQRGNPEIDWRLPARGEADEVR